MKIQLTNKNAKVPERMTQDSAGYDLYSPISVSINPNETVKINLGIRIAISTQCFGMIVPRSSMGIKKNIGLANTVGIIDADYRDDIIVALRNYGNEPQKINAGDRIAQIIFLQYGVSTHAGNPDNGEEVGYKYLGFDVVDELDKTERKGGIGSTGD
jgi:dUTP pyrophosphatase